MANITVKTKGLTSECVGLFANICCSSIMEKSMTYF